MRYDTELRNVAIVEKDLLDRLHDLKKSTPPSRPCLWDRSLHASALQKAIRRGELDEASEHAAALLELDPEYFWRRLRVIALEDVTLGNPEVVGIVLAVAGKRTLRRRYGEAILACTLVQALAAGEKDRTACDLVSWITFSPELETFRQSILALSVDAWLRAARDGSVSIERRAVALQLIAGLTRSSGGRFEVVTHADSKRFGACIDDWPISDLEFYIARRGSNTFSLNVALPFAALERRGRPIPPPTSIAIAPEPHIGTFNAGVLCMYTSLGRAAIADWLRTDARLSDAVRQAEGTSRQEAVGLAVFQVEGGLLDRRTDYAPWIRRRAEGAELAHCGLDEDDSRVLRQVVKEDIAQLHRAREKVWERYAAAADR